MNFLITYAEGQSLYRCNQLAGVGYDSTAVDWAIFCRDLFTEYYVRHIRDEQFLGEVEIDEALFGRRTKHHRGDPRGIKVWIFGIVERQINRLKVFPIDRRDTATVIPIIQQHVAPRTTVITDGWTACVGLHCTMLKTPITAVSAVVRRRLSFRGGGQYGHIPHGMCY